LDVLFEQHAQVKNMSIKFVSIKTLHPKEDESNKIKYHENKIECMKFQYKLFLGALLFPPKGGRKGWLCYREGSLKGM